jgi:hypothetical protein
MLLKAVGVLMMLDGVWLAAAVLPMLDTLVYRSLRDQSLFAAHLLIGALLLLSGRLVLSQKRDRDSFPRNESRSLFPSATLVASMVLNGLEVTRFDWPILAVHSVFTLGALFVLLRSQE